MQVLLALSVTAVHKISWRMCSNCSSRKKWSSYLHKSSSKAGSTIISLLPQRYHQTLYTQAHTTFPGAQKTRTPNPRPSLSPYPNNHDTNPPAPKTSTPKTAHPTPHPTHETSLCLNNEANPAIAKNKLLHTAPTTPKFTW